MAAIEEITDPRDPRVAAFTDIRERDLARGGGFIAEGTVVLDALLRSPFFRPAAILVLRNRLAGISGILARVPDDVPVLVAEERVIDEVAGFAMHRGVLAHGVRRETASPALGARLAALAGNGGSLVVAVGIANHDNIGGIFRNAAAFGADMVLLDRTCCDPLYRKAIRVSAGAVLHLPFERVDPAGLVAMLNDAGIRAIALSPRGRIDVAALDDGAPTALFLGAEGRGLPDALVDAMQTCRIDMTPGFDSLNVATSAAVALQRLYSGRRRISPD